MAKTYSHDLKVGDRLDKLSDSAMKATDEGFYGTASVKELVGWKISKVFRETKDVAEDKIYGGFCYMIATKDDQMIMAFRGTAGEMEASLLTRKGDWYNDFLTYPFGTDPGVEWAELAAEAPLNVNAELNNLYITGHSRAGMLSQVAGAKMVQEGHQKIIKKLTYFNGLGVVMNTKYEGIRVWDDVMNCYVSVVDENDVEILKKLSIVKKQIRRVRIINKNPIKYPLAPLSDVVAILGIHLVVSDDFGVTDIAYNNNSDIINKAHSMSNFTYHFVRGKEV